MVRFFWLGGNFVSKLITKKLLLCRTSGPSEDKTSVTKTTSEATTKEMLSNDLSSDPGMLNYL